MAFPVLEPILTTFTAQQLVPIAYEETQWTLHFIEKRFGVRAIHRLLRAFRDGLNTEEAIAKTVGKSIVEFDRELWRWCLEDAPEIWSTEVIEYDERSLIRKSRS